MNVTALNVTQTQAIDALRQYREHRDIYDKRDWEIERIYRAISKGKTVIDALGAIRRAGLDEKGRPRLAICEAHAHRCRFDGSGDSCTFGVASENGWKSTGRLKSAWPDVGYARGLALVPRIPPQYRPAGNVLPNYHILWEADWQDVPVDPYLLRRIGKDAWVVLAAWDLTEVELSVLRAHREGRQ